MQICNCAQFCARCPKPRNVAVTRYVVRWPVGRSVSQAVGQSKEKQKKKSVIIIE